MKVGDYVVVNDPYALMVKTINKPIAKVLGFNGDFVGLEFKENIYGHNCDGKGKDGYCWWAYRESCYPLNGSIAALLIERGDIC